MIKTVKVRALAEPFLDTLRELTPKELEEKYRHGDYIHIGPASFIMVHYSVEASDGEQSRWVTYWSPFYDLEINLDFTEETVRIERPMSDWESMGW
jgi:hypothetical protein